MSTKYHYSRNGTGFVTQFKQYIYMLYIYTFRGIWYIWHLSK